MANSLLTPSASDIRQRLDTYFDEAGLDNTIPGSPLYILTQSLVTELKDTYDRLNAVINNSGFYAKGTDLDDFMAFFGMSRDNATIAETSGKNIQFKTTQAIADLELVIPEGTEIYNEAETCKYLTTHDATLNDQTIYVAARAAVAGPTQNVKAGTLVKHNLANAATFAAYAASITVTNLDPIENGAWTADDATFSMQLKHRQALKYGVSLDGLYAKLMSEPGIYSVDITQSPKESGVFNVMIEPTEAVVSTNLYNKASGLLDAYSAPGVQPRLITHAYKHLGLKLCVNDATTADYMRELIADVINNAGQSVSIQQIVNAVYTAAQNPKVCALSLSDYDVKDGTIYNTSNIRSSVITVTGNQWLFTTADSDSIIISSYE